MLVLRRRIPRSIWMTNFIMERTNDKGLKPLTVGPPVVKWNLYAVRRPTGCGESVTGMAATNLQTRRISKLEILRLHFQRPSI